MASSDCLFCGIAAGEVPADIVFQDDAIVAFRDIQPQAPVHLLVIPRKHISSLKEATEADAAVLGRIQLTAKELAAVEGLSENGYRLVVNVGEDGGQAVYHIHYHLLGGRSLAWPPG